MDIKKFEEVLDGQIAICKDTLIDKAKEYASVGDDRLRQFKVAAELEGRTPVQVIFGMMVKHTLSLYDMGQGARDFTMSQWDEKITDHLNYLFLLKAALLDAKLEQNMAAVNPLPHIPSTIQTIPPDAALRINAVGGDLTKLRGVEL